MLIKKKCFLIEFLNVLFNYKTYNSFTIHTIFYLKYTSFVIILNVRRTLSAVYFKSEVGKLLIKKILVRKLLFSSKHIILNQLMKIG